MSSSQIAKQELPREEKEIVERFSSRFGDRAKVSFAKKNRLKFTLEAEDLIEAVIFVRDTLHFDHCTNITGTDFPKDNQIQVDYHFASIDVEGLRRIILALSVRVPSDDPKVPSIFREFTSAELHEREEAEMLGIVFEGHPDLTRLLLPEDWDDIPPLLKRYRLPGRLEGE